MDYQIIHSIPGRLRFLIPRLATDPNYVQKLQGLVESIKFVTEVRINAWAKSLVVSYKSHLISSDAIQKHLVNAIEQADLSAPFLSRESPIPISLPKKNLTPISSPSVSQPPINKETSHEGSQAVTEEAHSTSTSQKFAIEDPWDADSKSDSISSPATEPVYQEIVPLKQEASSIESNPARENKPKNKEKKETVSTLSTKALAKRLQVAYQTLTRNRSKPNFVEWTQAKDPEGVAWSYDLKSKTFYRISSPINRGETTQKT